MAREHRHAHPGRHGLAQHGLVVAIIATFGFALIELLAGWWSGSLALVSDAGHMFSDAAALTVAVVAERLAARPAGERHSFGFARAEVLAAFLNGLAMLVVVVAICVEAVNRLLHPAEISGFAAMVVAFIGLLVNLGVMWMLGSDHHSLNRRAASLHVMGDVLGSVGALTAGAVVTFTGWMTIDPLLSIFIAMLILFSTVNLLRTALHVLMEGVPSGLKLDEIGGVLAQIKGVRAVHDLHVWNISSGAVSLSAHLEMADLTLWPSVLEQSKQILLRRFHVAHVTLQPELTDGLNPGYRARVRIVPKA